MKRCSLLTTATSWRHSPIYDPANGHPSISELTAALNSIAALNGNVSVSQGADSNHFEITFINALAATNVNPIQVATTSAAATITTVTEGGTGGSTPDAAAVQANLDAIPALTGNVSVTGPAGGPYVITFSNGLTGVNVSQLTTAVTGSVTATPATTTEGSAPDAAAVQTNLNAIAALTGNVAVTGTAGGPYTITFSNALTGLNLNRLDNPVVTGGVTATPATTTDGSTPDGAAVQASLNAIPELTGNVTVTGSTGGPYTITFSSGLTGVNVSQLTTAVTGGVTAAAATTADGSAPDAAAVQANLNTIPALTGNIVVTGNAGGPYTITFNNALTGLNVNQLDDPAVTGGVTAAVATAADGSTPDAAAIQAALNVIPALSGNVEVLGLVGGPYTIVFTNGLAGLAAAQLTAAVTGGVTAHRRR